MTTDSFYALLARKQGNKHATRCRPENSVSISRGHLRSEVRGRPQTARDDRGRVQSSTEVQAEETNPKKIRGDPTKEIQPDTQKQTRQEVHNENEGQTTSEIEAEKRAKNKRKPPVQKV